MGPPLHAKRKSFIEFCTSAIESLSKTLSMDPFSSEGELVNIHTSFIQGQYASVLSDYTTSDFSESNRLPVKILQYRAQCELGQYDQVISSISDSDAKQTPDLAAAKIFAKYLKTGSELHLGRTEEAEAAMSRALELEPENKIALANKLVLDAVVGRDTSEVRSKLEKVDKEAEILADMMAKREAFQEACKKYSPK